MTDSAVDADWPPDFIKTIIDQLPEPPPGADLAEDTNLINLGLNSLRMIRLLVAIEDNFDITLPDDVLAIATFQTPLTLWAAVRSAQEDQG